MGQLSGQHVAQDLHHLAGLVRDRKGRSVHVVKEAWLTESAQAKRRLPESQYSLPELRDPEQRTLGFARFKPLSTSEATSVVGDQERGEHREIAADANSLGAHAVPAPAGPRASDDKLYTSSSEVGHLTNLSNLGRVSDTWLQARSAPSSAGSRSSRCAPVHASARRAAAALRRAQLKTPDFDV